MDSLKNAGPACPTTKVGGEEGEIGSCRGSYEEPSRTSEILFAAFEKGGMRQALKDLTIEINSRLELRKLFSDATHLVNLFR